MRTDEEKKEAIAALRKSKETMPEISFFGDNNHEAIDVAIEIIENEHDNDWLYDEYPDTDSCMTVHSWGGRALQWLDSEIDLKELLGDED